MASSSFNRQLDTKWDNVKIDDDMIYMILANQERESLLEVRSLIIDLIRKLSRTEPGQSVLLSGAAMYLDDDSRLPEILGHLPRTLVWMYDHLQHEASVLLDGVMTGVDLARIGSALVGDIKDQYELDQQHMAIVTTFGRLLKQPSVQSLPHWNEVLPLVFCMSESMKESYDGARYEITEEAAFIRGMAERQEIPEDLSSDELMAWIVKKREEQRKKASTPSS